MSEQPSTGVWSEIERRRVDGQLRLVQGVLRDLREDQRFWLIMAPKFRVRYEDFQGDLAALRACFRK